MTQSPEDGLREDIDTIEDTYEFMLAYAAQGRKREVGEGGGESQIRQYLKRFDAALSDFTMALDGGLGGEVGDGFAARVESDVAAVHAVVGLLLAQGSISSDMVDNANGLIAMRALLTDIFFIDQAVLPAR